MRLLPYSPKSPRGSRPVITGRAQEGKGPSLPFGFSARFLHRTHVCPSKGYHRQTAPEGAAMKAFLIRPPDLPGKLERAKALSIFYGVQRLSGISGGMRMGKLSFPAQNGFLALLSRPASGSASVKAERVAARGFCSLVHPPVRRSLDSEGSLRDESAGALFLSPESFSPTQNRPFTAATRG